MQKNPPKAEADSAAKRGPGAVSTFTQKAADEICERLAKGEPLAQICRSENMPAVRTVSDWKAEHKDFAAAFARAREEGFDVIAESCLQIADDGKNDTYKDDEGNVRVDHDHIQRSKLRIETRLKLLAKWDPKRYGEKLAIGGADDLPPIKKLSDEEIAAQIAALSARNGSAEQG